MSKNHLQVVEQQQPAVAKQQQPGMIMPAATIQEAVEAFEQYQALRDELGKPEDFQTFTDKDGNTHTFPKKSFVRKIQRFFNVSCEIIQDEPLYDKDGKIIGWLAKARAIHLATGAFQESDGSCGWEEKPEKQRTLHNLRSHAITRAKNRAILDLVGFGDISAEEIGERVTSQRQQAQPVQQADSNLATIKQKKTIYAKAKAKGLTDDQIKKLVRYHLQRDTNNMTKQEASDLIKLVNEMSRDDLINLIGEKAIDAEVIDFDPVEVEEAMNGGGRG